MPFRCRQKMFCSPAGSIVYSVASPNPDTGILEYKDVSQQVKLPGVEMTDLAASLKAGVSLEQVSCKLVNGSSTVASLNKAIEKASKSATTNLEVNDAE